MSMKGKVAVITGATSGIGEAAARVFAEAGTKLVLTGRDEARGNAVLAALGKTADAAFVAGDIRDRGFCDRLIEGAVTRFGRLDALVNNAGMIKRSDAIGTSDEDWLETMAVNVNAVFYLSRAAVRVMKPQGKGAIVNVSSEWGLVGGKGHVAYCTSKGAVINMTRAMALDHAGDGIRINAVCPGEVNTPMLRSGLKRRGFDVESGLKELGKSVPLGRVSEPEEIGRLILFLASDDSSYMAGSIVAIDGGNTAR
jgi:NAD(P)-dependent dehydrogenase (short-subunit alcohol dehydrogenase family)